MAACEPPIENFIDVIDEILLRILQTQEDVNGKVFKANFLDKSIEMKGESHQEVAYLLALVLLKVNKLRNFSTGLYEQITVTNEDFVKIFNAWKTEDGEHKAEMECVRSIATDKHIQSLSDISTVTEQVQSLATSSNHVSTQPDWYVSKSNEEWQELFSPATLSPSKGSDLQPVMEKVFGHVAYKPKQEQALDFILKGENVFASLPTSGGKSLLYMLPSIVIDSLTVVVEPLKSLIEDQFTRCKELGISAAVLHSNISYSDREKIYAELAKDNSDIRLLFVIIEFLVNTPSLLELLHCLSNKNKLRQFVIDEAHCVSQWGHDFRPAYKFLKTVHTTLSKIPFLLLSASAPLNVREDICGVIGLTSVALVNSSCIRPNLHYEVSEKRRDTIEEITKLLLKEECGLVYCNTRAETELVAAKLQTANVNCKPYHGGLSAGLKKQLQSLWINGYVSTLVYTTAFGMGIDKPNVSIVIHYSIPSSMEEYYKQSGRGGRNGCPCKCVLFFSHNDKAFHLREIHDYCSVCNIPIYLNSRMLTFQNIIKYSIQKGGCRWQTIATHFGEEMSPCSNCDLCSKKETYNVTNITNHAITAIKCLQRIKSSGKSNFTLRYLAMYLQEKSQKSLFQIDTI